MVEEFGAITVKFFKADYTDKEILSLSDIIDEVRDEIEEAIFEMVGLKAAEKARKAFDRIEVE